MKIGFQVILYILILNMVSALMYQTSVAGTSQSDILAGTPNATNITSAFNTSDFMSESRSFISEFLTFTGHIWGALNTVYLAVRMVLFGFPDMLNQIGYQINNPSARLAFTSFSYLLYAVFSIVIFIWFFEILTGREVQE